MSGLTVVFVGVVGARFLLPLLIPRFPLPAVVACLVLDGVDQTIFQTFGYDPPSYQGYDKAMDVYYLAIAYLATMRNWASMPAFGIGRFLYFYRLVGVVTFELSQLRWILIVFPNTFEYFFIAYEAVRSRWQPLRFALRWWVTVAAAIWVFIKLPQEWWLHVAQLDVTDFLREHDWAPPLLLAALVVLGAVLWFVVRPRLRPPDWDLRVAADPLPEAVDTAREQAAWRAASGAVWSWTTAEKVVLVGLIAVIYAEVLPGIDVTNRQLFTAVAAFVVANAAITLAAARRSWTVESTALAVGARLLVNVALVVAARVLLGSGSITWATLFFLSLISLITTLHDRYQPVLALRRGEAQAQQRSAPPVAG